MATVICQHHKLGPEETVTIVCNLDEFQTKLSDQDKKDQKRQIFLKDGGGSHVSMHQPHKPEGRDPSHSNLLWNSLHDIPRYLPRHPLSVGIYISWTHNIRIESGDCECLSQGKGVGKCATEPDRKYGRHTLCEYGISSSSPTIKELKILMQLSHWQRSQQLSTDLWQTCRLSGRDGSGVSETISNKSECLSNSDTSVFTIAFNCIRIR